MTIADNARVSPSIKASVIQHDFLSVSRMERR